MMWNELYDISLALKFYSFFGKCIYEMGRERRENESQTITYLKPV